MRRAGPVYKRLKNLYTDLMTQDQLKKRFNEQVAAYNRMSAQLDRLHEKLVMTREDARRSSAAFNYLRRRHQVSGRTPKGLAQSSSESTRLSSPLDGVPSARPAEALGDSDADHRILENAINVHYLDFSQSMFEVLELRENLTRLAKDHAALESNIAVLTKLINAQRDGVNADINVFGKDLQKAQANQIVRFIHDCVKDHVRQEEETQQQVAEVKEQFMCPVCCQKPFDCVLSCCKHVCCGTCLSQLRSSALASAAEGQSGEAIDESRTVPCPYCRQPLTDDAAITFVL